MKTTNLRIIRQAVLTAVAATFMLMPARATADGLPGEYLLTQRWRDAIVPYSPLANPAFLVRENYSALRGAFATTFGATFRLWEVGATQPIGMYQSVGLSWVGQQTVLFDETVAGAATGNKTGDMHNFFMGTYAVNPWNSLTLGVNLNVLYQDAFGDSRAGFGADLGLAYEIIRNARFGNHAAGLMLQNAVAPATGDEALSRDVRIALLSDYWEKSITSRFAFDVKDILADAAEFQKFDTLASRLVNAPTAFEWAFSGAVGYTLARMFSLRVFFGLNQSGFDYWGVGVQANLPQLNLGRDLAAGFQYNGVQEDQISMQTSSLRAELDGHREANYARRMAGKLDVAPSNLYQKAMTLHSQGKYWEAHLILHQILNNYPDFFKNDWVSYYAGNCQEMMDMRESARKTYSAVVADYPRSPSAMHANLGAMRVNYREGNLDQAEQLFGELTQPEVTDSLKKHACYLMGQIFIARKDYENAVYVLQEVSVGHPMFLFAMHSSGVAMMLMDKPETAADMFEACITGEPKTAAERAIVERSLLFVGYMLYEGLIKTEHSFSKSVAVLRKIPASSTYYEEAQQCLGWAAIKARRYNDCGATSAVLLKSNNPVLRADGMLMEGHCRTMQEDYEGARAVLQRGVEFVAAQQPPSEDSLMTEKQRYAGVRASYDLLARNVVEKAQSIGIAMAPAELDRMHEEQRTMKQRLDSYIEGFDAFARGAYFGRTLPEIKQDLEYSLASVTWRLNAKSKGVRKMEQEQQKIEQEIDKLKQELNGDEKGQ